MWSAWPVPTHTLTKMDRVGLTTTTVSWRSRPQSPNSLTSAIRTFSISTTGTAQLRWGCSQIHRRRFSPFTPSVIKDTRRRTWLEHLPIGTHHFSWYEGSNPLAGAIALADRVIAVSPNYAREIVTPEGGMGLHERLQAVGDRLVGIRNGIDTRTWNPASDPQIAARFDAGDMSGREICRDHLLKLAGWSNSKPPIVATVTRLVEQKGIDLLLEASRYLDRLPARLAVLGAGDATLAAAFARPGL